MALNFPTTETIATPVTKLLRCRYPIILAGMNKAAGPVLAAAVSNSGGVGVVGGVGYTPKMLSMLCRSLKKRLRDPSLPWGVDLLLPKVGQGARATNKDYTKGTLDKLIDVIIAEGATMFVCAVGVPPKRVVDKLHAAGILCANMVGSPKHVKYALDVGMDMIVAQGGEGGGHTGEIGTSVLIPECVDLCRVRKSPLTGERVLVVAAGGIYDGRGLVMALGLGADAVWVGTRFVCSEESGASMEHKHAIIKSGYHDNKRTLVYTGRPMRIIKNDYIKTWEKDRPAELEKVLKAGKLPLQYDLKRLNEQNDPYVKSLVQKGVLNPKEGFLGPGFLVGQASGMIKDILPARTIIGNMMTDAINVLRYRTRMVSKL